MLSKEYALAFYQIGSDLDIVDSIETEFGLLVDLVNKEPEFMKMMAHPKLSIDEKKEIVSKVMVSFDQHLQDFCFVLIDNGRFEYLQEVYEQFVLLIKKEQNIMVVNAISAKQLTYDDVVKLTTDLRSKYGKKIEIVAIVDENVIGGVRLEFNGKVLDTTLKANLDNLKSNLI